MPQTVETAGPVHLNRIKPFLFGRFHFEDQHRAAVIKQGRVLLHIVFMDDTRLRTIIAPIQDVKYLKEIANTDDDLPRVKAACRRLLKKSPLTGLKRETTKKARGVLKEILDL